MISKNEWDPLLKVIVGVADNAKIPNIDVSVRTVNYADRTDKELQHIKPGLYPEQVITEANEDLDTLCQTLKKESVEVLRPDRTNCDYYNYCPRDTVLHYKDISLASPMSLRVRKNEYKAFDQHLNNIKEVQYSHPDTLYNVECIGDKHQLALHETEPAFDAANVLRADEKLLYLVSNSGNLAGAKLLKEIFNVEVCLMQDVYSYMHIDSTVSLLRDGLLLINPSRIKRNEDIPVQFRSWDKIVCPEPYDIGFYPGYCNSSPWINMNLFSINPNLVVLEEHQHSLRKELEKYNIDCAMLPMRQARTLGGCFHCVTLDIERKHSK